MEVTQSEVLSSSFSSSNSGNKIMSLVYENGKYILEVSDLSKPAELNLRHSEKKYFGLGLSIWKIKFRINYFETSLTQKRWWKIF